jgi:DNA-binding NarL/FixJ family response regulator
MSTEIRVLIADDHAIVREGMKQIAMADRSIVVAGETSTADETLRKVQSEPFDVVVLDLSFPDRSGLEIIADIKRARPSVAVLVLSMEPQAEFAMRCLRAGASSYLEKRAAPEQLVRAIRRLAEGKKYLSGEFAQQLVIGEIHHPNAEHPHDLLSPREFEVFLSIARGKPAREIAADFGLSVKTVNNHRAHILEKLRIKSTAELVRYAMRHQLIH